MEASVLGLAKMGTGINTILGIALTVLAIIIVSALLYGKDQGLLSKIADRAISFGDMFLPDTASKQQKQQEKLPSKVVAAQNSFVESIKRASQRNSEGYCLLGSDLSGLDKYEMQIKGPGVISRIVDPRYSGTLISTKEGEVLLNPVIFENAEVLLFDVKKYSLCFGKEGMREDTSMELFKDCRPENLCYKPASLLLSKKGIKLKDRGYGALQQILALPDKKSFCLIPMHTTLLGSGCDIKEETINENCIGKIKGMIKSSC